MGLLFVRCKSVPTHDEDFKVNIRVYLYALKMKWNNKYEIKISNDTKSIKKQNEVV